MNMLELEMRSSTGDGKVYASINEIRFLLNSKRCKMKIKCLCRVKPLMSDSTFTVGTLTEQPLIIT